MVLRGSLAVRQRHTLSNYNSKLWCFTKKRYIKRGYFILNTQIWGFCTKHKQHLHKFITSKACAAVEMPFNLEFGGVTPLWVLTPWSSCLQAPELLPLPFHLMKRHFSLRQDSWSPSPLTFSWNHQTKWTKRKECIRKVGEKNCTSCALNITPACLALSSMSTPRKEVYHWTSPRAEQWYNTLWSADGWFSEAASNTVVPFGFTTKPHICPH